MTKLLDADTMRKAFQLVDSELKNKARFIVGGGAAMTLAYSHPLATHDVDAFAARGGLSIADVDALAKKIATRLGIAGDWLNSHFDTYTIVLPSDYATRLRRVFNGKQLTVDALGPEDLLIMKCFAARAMASSDAPMKKLFRPSGAAISSWMKRLKGLPETRRTISPSRKKLMSL